MDETKICLPESEIPVTWYNILPDMPIPMAPVINPATLQPVTPDDLKPIFPMALIEQEMSAERYIPIPEPVREAYALWRPTPLFRARRLEKALGTPARIYYKYEGVSPAGSHKPNTAVAQAYYNKQAGINRLTTETGAGQWGSALALAGQLFGLEIKVYMVKISYQQKPYRRSMIQTWGATVIPSPSNETQSGRAILAQDPDSTGSLGIAISEAVEEAALTEGTNYALGSVLNHVLLHQTVIGEETIEAFKMFGDYPDVVIGCVGGGSNYGGIMLPFMRERLQNGKETTFIAVEPKSCPTLTKGLYEYDFGDTGKMTPIMKMHTLGHTFVPPGIHAGGLRYHGMAPIISSLVKAGLVEPRAYYQNEVFAAAVQFARSEGIIPAPETAHAIKATIDEALKAKETGEEKAILFNFSGHGHFDMGAYDAYFADKLQDFAYPEEKIQAALHDLPKVEL